MTCALVVLLYASPPIHAETPPPSLAPSVRATAFARNLAEAFAARDPRAAGALFARDAVSTLVGAKADERGRVAIEQNFRATFARYRDVRLDIGRVWADGSASIVEFVFSGRRAGGELMGRKVGERRVGLVGALVVIFDDEALVKTQRLYLDVPTIIGQVERRLLPASTVIEVRPVATAL